MATGLNNDQKSDHKLLLVLPTQVDSERLLLRPYQAGDGERYYALCQNNKAHLLPYEAGNPALSVNTVEEAEVLVRQFAINWMARDSFFFGAWEKATGVLVAQIVVMVVNWELPEFEIGYFVDKDHEGRGFVTEGTRAILKFVFEHLKAQRVSANCSDTNDRSWHVMERCGLVREGHLRQNHAHLKRDDGTPSGQYMYGILRAEFEKLSALTSLPSTVG